MNRRTTYVCYVLETRKPGSQYWDPANRITTEWHEAAAWVNTLDLFARETGNAEARWVRKEVVQEEARTVIATDSNPDLE